MRAAVAFLALLLARLSPVDAAATGATAATTASMAEEKASGPEPEGATAPKQRDDPSREPFILHAPDGKGGRTPVIRGPVTGGKTDVTGAEDKNLREVTAFVDAHLEAENSGLSYVLVKAEVQVVAGLMYTLHYSGNDADGACTAGRVIVVYDRPWLKTMSIKSDTETDCPES